MSCTKGDVIVVSVIISLFAMLVVGFIYAKKVDEKERNRKSDISDAFLLLLIGMSGVPFVLMFLVSIFVVITK